VACQDLTIPERATLRPKGNRRLVSDLPDTIPVTEREIDLLLALLGDRMSEILDVP
jgi:hypothetical protein